MVATTSSFLMAEAAWKPDLSVVARILAILFEDGPTNRTNLSSKSGLNYRSFKKYLEWMIKHDFVLRY